MNFFAIKQWKVNYKMSDNTLLLGYTEDAYAATVTLARVPYSANLYNLKMAFDSLKKNW